MAEHDRAGYLRFEPHYASDYDTVRTAIRSGLQYGLNHITAWTAVQTCPI